MKKKSTVVAVMMGLGLLVPTQTLAQPLSDGYVYQPFQDKQTMQTVNRLYRQMSWEERIAQLHGVTPGRLTDKNGKLSPEKCKETIPYGIGHVCQFACALDNEPDKLRDFVADLQAWLKANTNTVMCSATAASPATPTLPRATTSSVVRGTTRRKPSLSIRRFLSRWLPRGGLRWEASPLSLRNMVRWMPKGSGLTFPPARPPIRTVRLPHANPPALPKSPGRRPTQWCTRTSSADATAGIPESISTGGIYRNKAGTFSDAGLSFVVPKGRRSVFARTAVAGQGRAAAGAADVRQRPIHFGMEALTHVDRAIHF